MKVSVRILLSQLWATSTIGAHIICWLALAALNSLPRRALCSSSTSWPSVPVQCTGKLVFAFFCRLWSHCSLCGRLPAPGGDSGNKMAATASATFHFVLLALLGAVLLLQQALPVQCGMVERHLINQLLENYNPLERPVMKETDRLNVNFSVTLQQIIDVDEKNQILISNLWLNIKWIDINLRWDPAEYNNITSIRISPDRIWIPDMLLYNSADERFDSTFRTNVVVSNDGSMLFIPPGIFKSTCRIDITWFPFDDQACVMKFGTWTHGGLAIDLIIDNKNADVSAYIENSEWVLVGVPGVRNEISYDCCPEPYIDITFTVHIKRRTLYYGFNLIIPCIILSSMTLLSFSLPPESGEKLHLGVTILLSMTVFLVQLGKILPATSDSVSIIALYFGSIMVMVAFSVVMTVVVLNFHHRSTETKEMGPWIKFILLNILPRIIGMQRPGIKPPKQCLQKNKQFNRGSSIICVGKVKEDTDDGRQCLPLPPLPPDGFRHFVPTEEGVVHQLGNSFEENDVSQTLHGSVDESHPHFGGVLYAHQYAPPMSQQQPMECHSKGARMDYGRDNEEESRDCEEGDDEEEDEEEEEVAESGGQEVDDLDVSISITDSSSAAAKAAARNLNQLKLLAKSKESVGNISLKSFKNNSTLKKKTPTHSAGQGAQGHNRCSESQQQPKTDHPHDPFHQIRHQYLALKRKHKLLEILLEMKFITDRLRKEDETKEIIAEWRYAATVLDRLCLIMFTFFTTLSLAVCLLSAPQLIV